MLTHDRLKTLLSYNPITGLFQWRVRRNGYPLSAGCIKPSGYRVITVDGRGHRAGRLAWFYMTGCWPSQQIDHINRNPADDRFANLREATQNENQANRKLFANNRAGFKGVHCIKGRWRAMLSVNGKNHHIGYFDGPSAAQAAYAEAAIAHYGEFVSV